ncbi:MAG TPA: type IV secretion system DNA-binding domain-containing protein [Thermodesulfobacteriota bacterium]|nr:type IV secretion system DNA-binding domain-containing protein [Thermodesulfobacteriota bacterium]
MTRNEDRENEVYYIGETNYRNERTRFGIKKKDRRSHMYIIGKTGVGKSTLIKNLVIQNLKKGNGLALLDPHGDLAEDILDYIPEWRENDVIYFNPADRDYAVGFNVFEGVNSSNRHLVASELISVFKKLWSDSWGPRLEHILRNSILSLAEYPGTTLLDLPRILVDAEFRKTVLLYVTDNQVKEFWMKEFEKYPANFRAEAIAPIQNKAGAFLTNSLTRNILGQKRSAFNMREVMDSGKVLIANLAKGKIGEDTSMLLGSLLVTKIEQAALSRADTPEEKRRDFYLYIDEFHTFTTGSFADMLPEARKYRLCLILVHQYLEQIDEKTVAAIFGNAGTVITFRTGARDAEYLAREFYPDFRVEDFINLPAYHIYLRLMIDGVASNPFSAATLPPSDERSYIKEKVTDVSRKLHGKIMKAG